MGSSSSRTTQTQPTAVLSFREKLPHDAETLGSGWSRWIPAIMLQKSDEFEDQRGLDMTGYIRPKTSLVDTLKEKAPKSSRGDTEQICGIYELAVIKPQSNGDPGSDGYVVYIGNAGNIAERINSYCKTGSHKEDEISNALRLNYDLYTRFRRTDTKKDAEEEEDNILQKVTYAWNIRYPNPAPRRLPPLE